MKRSAKAPSGNLRGFSGRASPDLLQALSRAKPTLMAAGFSRGLFLVFVVDLRTSVNHGDTADDNIRYLII